MLEKGVREQPPVKHVLCLGCSYTEGKCGSDWIGVLNSKHPSTTGLSFVNEGINGDLSVNVLRRLDSILARVPSPHAVILWVGGNDLLASSSASWGWVLSQYKRLRGFVPTLESYQDSVREILALLAQRAPGARIAVLNTPPHGEDLASDMNDRVRMYNAALEQVLSQRPGVTYLDYHAECARFLRQTRPQEPEGGSEAVSFDFIPVTWNLFSASLQRSLLWRSWDDVSAAAGLRLFTDQVHLNDTAAALLISLLETSFIEPALLQIGPAATRSSDAQKDATSGAERNTANGRDGSGHSLSSSSYVKGNSSSGSVYLDACSTACDDAIEGSPAARIATAAAAAAAATQAADEAAGGSAAAPGGTSMPGMDGVAGSAAPQSGAPAWPAGADFQ